MATSSVPSVKNMLEDVFADALVDAGTDGGRVPVTQGEPKRSSRERVEIVGAVGRSDAMTMGASAGFREEVYAVEVWIYATNPGKTQRDATSRAFELLGYLEDTLRTDPTIGLVPTFEEMDAQPGDFEERLWTDEEGYCAALIWHVEIRAGI